MGCEIPRPTCPKIDVLLERLVELRADLRVNRPLENLYATFGELIDALEDLRDDNAQLRMGVFHYKELYEDLQTKPST